MRSLVSRGLGQGLGQGPGEIAIDQWRASQIDETFTYVFGQADIDPRAGVQCLPDNMVRFRDSFRSLWNNIIEFMYRGARSEEKMILSAAEAIMIGEVEACQRNIIAWHEEQRQHETVYTVLGVAGGLAAAGGVAWWLFG